MAENNNENQKTKYKTPKRTKALIGFLTTALILTAGVAVASPFVLNKIIKPTPTEATYFTVKFDSAGGSNVPDQEVKSGDKVYSPQVEWADHTLVGWFAPGQSEPWDFDKNTVTNNITLTAKWNEVPQPEETRYITFLAGEGSFDPTTSVKSKKLRVIKGRTWSDIKDEDKPTVYISDDKYSFSQWIVTATGNPLTSDYVFDHDTTIKATFLQTNYVTLSFTCNESAGEYITGPKSQQLTKGDAWSDTLANSAIATKDNYEFKGWSLKQDGTEADILTPSTTFSSSATIYPVFKKNANLVTLKFNYHPEKQQEITEGSDTYTISVPDEGTTWSKVVKPTATQAGGKYVFSGWYKKDPYEETTITEEWLTTNAWKETDEIKSSGTEMTTFEAYAYFVIPVVEPKITFMAKTDETADVTFIGNTFLQVTFPEGQTSVNFGAIENKPAAFYKIDGDWQKGFTSIKSFDKWVMVDPDDETKYVDVPSTYPVSKSLTVYPVFVDKPAYTYKTGAETSPKFYYNPTDSFGQVKKPTVAYKVDDTYFKGWAYEGSTDLLTNDTIIGETDKTVVPVYDTNIIEVKFDDYGYIKVGDTFEQITDGTIAYDGGNQIAIDKADTKPNDVMKPLAEITPNSGSSSTYTFSHWQYYDPDTTTWYNLESGAVVPLISSTFTGTVQFRPIFTKNITITYSDALGGKIKSGQTKLGVSSSQTFQSFYKPEWESTPEGYVFKQWCIKSGDEYIPVAANATFDTDTTLYATFSRDVLTTVINFHLKDEDKAAGATLSGSSIAIDHKEGAGPDFSTITKGYATKPCYNFLHWATKEDDITYKEFSGKIPDVAELNLYAVFDQITSYRKVSVQTSEEYTVKDGEAFIKTNDPLLANFHPTITKVGEELDYFTYNGEKVDSTTKVVDNDMVLTPVFKEAKRILTISDDGVPGVKNVMNRMIQVGKGESLMKYINELKSAPLQPELANSTFIDWQVKNPDGTYRPYTQDEIIESNITLVPKWQGEAEFLVSKDAYFFDTDRLGGQSKWARITDFTGDALKIEYSDGVISSIDKSKFNYEVKFGTAVTSVPDYFMQGCYNWNNGGKTLTLTKNINSIGKFFLHGCTSFNQEIDFTACTPKKNDSGIYIFNIGESFMLNCYSFNKDMNFTFTNCSDAVINLGKSFMSECYSLSSITITANAEFRFADGATTDNYSLSTSNQYSPLATTGVRVAGNKSNGFVKLLPAISGPRYRRYI